MSKHIPDMRVLLAKMWKMAFLGGGSLIFVVFLDCSLFSLQICWAGLRRNGKNWSGSTLAKDCIKRRWIGWKTPMEKGAWYCPVFSIVVPILLSYSKLISTDLTYFRSSKTIFRWVLWLFRILHFFTNTFVLLKVDLDWLTYFRTFYPIKKKAPSALPRQRTTRT